MPVLLVIYLYYWWSCKTRSPHHHGHPTHQRSQVLGRSDRWVSTRVRDSVSLATHEPAASSSSAPAASASAAVSGNTRRLHLVSNLQRHSRYQLVLEVSHVHVFVNHCFWRKAVSRVGAWRLARKCDFAHAVLDPASDGLLALFILSMALSTPKQIWA